MLVSDTGIGIGIGIAPEDVPTAFERFGQIDSPLSPRYEGTGLGLSLTKQLVKLHGGTVQLSSVVGKGATVLVVFPLERVMDGNAILEAKAA